MPRGLENKATLNHPGNAVVRTLTLSLDPWETHVIGSNIHNKEKMCINNVRCHRFFDLCLILFVAERSEKG
jgi:hypothetical protein